MKNEDPIKKAEKEANKIRIFLDDQEEPIVTYRPPVRFELDTTQLEDGTHKIRIEATDAVGKIGIRTVNFEVRNGPGISIEGLKDRDVLDGKVPVLINAYGGASEPFWEPARAETPAPVPTWAWVLLLAIVGWSMVYFAQQWNPPDKFASSPTYSFYTPNKSAAEPVEKPSLEAKANVGATLYRTSCGTCHQANGMGVPGAFPPLAGDPVVTAEDPTRHIEIILYGLQGKAINGVDYATIMPPFAKQLSDEEVAAIVNHERTSWGNSAPTVTAEDVREVRAKGDPNP